MDIEEISERRRQRSSRRLRHEAEVKVFQDQTGTLEGIRNQLGLRPSQICEILKVHPSAWTRWSKGNRAPPHVYQMLEWYMELLHWRGQHHPLKERPQGPQILRREDLETYVPQDNLQGVSFKKEVKGSWPKSIRILFIVWCIQTVLWCMVMGVLLKYR